MMRKVYPFSSVCKELLWREYVLFFVFYQTNKFFGPLSGQCQKRSCENDTHWSSYRKVPNSCYQRCLCHVTGIVKKITPKRGYRVNSSWSIYSYVNRVCYWPNVETYRKLFFFSDEEKVYQINGSCPQNITKARLNECIGLLIVKEQVKKSKSHTTKAGQVIRYEKTWNMKKHEIWISIVFTCHISFVFRPDILVLVQLSLWYRCPTEMA